MPSSSIELGVTPLAAFEAMAQLERAPLWMSHLTSVRRLGDREAVMEAELEGKRKAWAAWVTEARPGRSLAWRSEGEVGLEVRATFAAAGLGGTLLRVDLSWRAPDDKPWARPLREFGAQQLAGDLERFRALAEGTATGRAGAIEPLPA